MRWLGSLLITIALALGALAGATAYVVDLSAPDKKLEGKTLRFAAGKSEDGPLAGANDALSLESLDALRTAGVRRVTIKEFDLSLWTGKWAFLGSLAGLTAGAVLLRKDARRRLAATAATAEPGAIVTDTPEFIIQSLTESLYRLRQDLPGLPDEPARLHAIIGRLDHAQRSHIADFVDARQTLIGRHGLGGYAMIMDRFAAAERQINRAWSAAADGVYDEAETCLKAAADRLRETSQALKR